MNVVIDEAEQFPVYFVKPVSSIADNFAGQVVDLDESTWKRWQAIRELWEQYQDELQALYRAHDDAPESDE